MTIHTDVADAVTRHQITQKLLYQGSVYDVCEALTEFAKGGQVAMSAATFGRLTHDARKFHNTKEVLQVTLARTKQSAMRRQNAALKLQERIHRCAALLLCCCAQTHRHKEGAWRSASNLRSSYR